MSGGQCCDIGSSCNKSFCGSYDDIEKRSTRVFSRYYRGDSCSLKGLFKVRKQDVSINVKQAINVGTTEWDVGAKSALHENVTMEVKAFSNEKVNVKMSFKHPAIKDTKIEYSHDINTNYMQHTLGFLVSKAFTHGKVDSKVSFHPHGMCSSEKGCDSSIMSRTRTELSAIFNYQKFAASSKLNLCGTNVKDTCYNLAASYTEGPCVFTLSTCCFQSFKGTMASKVDPGLSVAMSGSYCPSSQSFHVDAGFIKKIEGGTKLSGKVSSNRTAGFALKHQLSNSVVAFVSNEFGFYDQRNIASKLGFGVEVSV